MQNIIVIVGPTGVGKTKLSIELAKKLDAEIINGDSVSIYKKLNIGSAKPTKEEQSQVRHHLIDICEPSDDYSVYNYQKDVRLLIDNLTKKNKRIIIVGGTGLYIKSALYDYNFSKEFTSHTYDELSNEEIIEKIRNFQSNIDLPHKNNRQRLVRLLNKLENNIETSNNKDKAVYPHLVIGLTTDRDYLYERINNRVDEMFKNNLFEEVTSLKEDYKTSRVLNSAIGYKEFINYFSNKETLAEVKEKIKQNSRHYAKRQYTFFNHQFHTNWFNVDFNDFSKTINEVIAFLDKQEKI